MPTSRDIWTIGEGVHAIQPTGVDEVHEQVPCPGAVERLVAQGVFAMEDRHLECLVRLLRTVVVPRSAGLAQEQGRAVRGDVPAGVSGERNDDGVQRSGVRVRGPIFVPITRGEPAVIAQRGAMRALRGDEGDKPRLADRLTMRRPACVSQYVRRFRSCRRSDCGIDHGSGIKGQCVTAFALFDPLRALRKLRRGRRRWSSWLR
jgi:hypothetical protein